MADRNALFKHYPMNAAIVSTFNDRLDSDGNSWRARRARGEYLAWRNDTFVIRGKKELRAYITWHAADGTNLIGSLKRLPACTVIAPAAPFKGAFLTATDALRYAESADRAQQKFLFDAETPDPALYGDWLTFCTEMRELLGPGRASHLANTLDEHEYLTAADRKEHKKKGPDALVARLVEAIEDEHNRSQHECRFWSMKHSLLQRRYGDGPMNKVCEADRELLADGTFDPSGKLQAFLESADDYYSINPLRIALAKPGETVQPAELGLMMGGGTASAELTFFGLNMRSDGQHSVMGACTGVALLTNGEARQQAVAGVDMLDMLMLSSAGAPPAKRLKTEAASA